MRILQAISGQNNGGAEAFFFRLAVALKEEGIEQEILVRKNLRWGDALLSEKISVQELPFKSAIDGLTKLRFRQAIQLFKPDIVLTWMSRATSFCPKPKELDTPFVHVARLGGYYNMKYYKNCDYLIANTEKIFDYIRTSGISRTKIKYLPNFVDENKTEPTDKSAYSTPPDAKVILTLSRFHPNKGLEILIEAMTNLQDVYLWLAGDGELWDDLEKLSVKLGVRPRVRFLGWHDDPSPLLSSCDLVICPSRIEPLGNVILDAWAHKVPVVATTSDGPKSLIKNKKNGILVPVDDSKTLSLAIKNLLRDPKMIRRLVFEGKRTFDSNFTKGIVVNKYRKFFKEVLA